MWILKIIQCFLQGHIYKDINKAGRRYKYCLRCGKVKEPTAILINDRICSKPVHSD